MEKWSMKDWELFKKMKSGRPMFNDCFKNWFLENSMIDFELSNDCIFFHFTFLNFSH